MATDLISSIPAGLAGIKSLIDIVGMIRRANNLAEVNEQANKFTAVITDIQSELVSQLMTNAALIAQKADLEKKLTDLENWEREKERYELAQPARGVFAYVEKSGVQPRQQAMFICARCYNQREASILQNTSRQHGRTSIHMCPSCKTEYVFGDNPPPRQMYADNGGDSWMR